MKSRIDDVDRSIVDLLMGDGRMPCAEIARALGNVSARTVRSRIRRLSEKGIIKVTAVASAKALGYRIVADISIETEPRKVREVAEVAATIESVSYVAVVAGDRDLFVQANAADIEDLQALITEELQAIPGVRSTRTTLLTQILKDIYEWRIPAELP